MEQVNNDSCNSRAYTNIYYATLCVKNIINIIVYKTIFCIAIAFYIHRYKLKVYYYDIQ